MKSLSVSEVAKLVGVSRNKVYRKLHNGTLSRNTIGKIDIVEVFRIFPENEYQYATQNDTQNGTQQNTAVHDNGTTENNQLMARLEAEIHELKREKSEYWQMYLEERERANSAFTALTDMREKRGFRVWPFKKRT